MIYLCCCYLDNKRSDLDAHLLLQIIDHTWLKYPSAQMFLGPIHFSVTSHKLRCFSLPICAQFISLCLPLCFRELFKCLRVSVISSIFSRVNVQPVSALVGMQVVAEGWAGKAVLHSEDNEMRTSRHRLIIKQPLCSQLSWVPMSAYGGQLDLWLETRQQRRSMVDSRVFNLPACASSLLLTSRPDSLLLVTLTCFT